MPVEKIAFGGWPNCVRLANEHAELICTTDVGPRAISYRTASGENVFWIDEATSGKTGEAAYQVRGGHRLWISPEDSRTYAPDNATVEMRAAKPLGVVLENPALEPWKIRKRMSLSLDANSSAVFIEHRLTNEGTAPVTIASWGLTVMRRGGFEIIPQQPHRAHGVGGLAPDRVVVPWSYMDFSDARWKFGRKFWVFTPKAGADATKLGFAHRSRWVAWSRGDTLFFKTFDFEDGAFYPDLGCNYETFSEGEFLEMESLGPLRTLAPGQSGGHTETWHLFAGVAAPAGLDDAALERWLAPFLAKIGIA